ncbi:transient receptor potential ca2 channel (trp-cc) family protein [Plasmopara halstedii]|uniref:Transient receptor potential ca2 channel (Trp-cc) family protein n=1 Tax=Plasmopara halstedii TaxID=4781 RepID=A0A0P1B135_PLAHL|nr:transient receptor potential ca2 channel (trp-cc) family protein [Plasmopara halstedii]CEG47005.1 transient receptor potential ca2 channel (trp-cc) family protein [Plasmopara halstedii]|eukprot:XP_024583374.1 transient receptor potential ca2 channel (trp-cc) family protein [Plasmopara halstedii]
MYEGMSTPQNDKVILRTSDMDAMTLSNENQPISASIGGHGALRDIDHDSHRNPMIPLMNQGTVNSTAISRLSVSSRLSLNQMGTSHVGQLRRRLPSRMSSKKRSFYHAHHRNALRGKMPHVPHHWLNARFRHNSFFAQRLLRTGIPLSMVLVTGLGIYYFYKPHWLVLNSSFPHVYGFELQSPRIVYTFQATSCENVVGFSALIYHTLPAVILLCLPGSGWRLFEPFNRDDSFSPAASGAQVAKTDIETGNGGMDLDDDEEDDNNLSKIKRRLVFQFCEVVAVVLLLFQAFVILFFLYMFFKGGVFKCNLLAVQLFALVSVMCFCGIFMEVRHFARFREHIKMLLGAFRESDQTGDIRNHVMDPGFDQLKNQSAKALAVVRKRLYKATRHGDLRAMRDILDYAQAAGLTSEAQGFPRKSYAPATLVLGFFACSRKNPVHVAAYHGNIRALELLEARGFDVMAMDKFSRVRISTGDLFWYFARYFVTRPGIDGGASEDESAVSIFRSTLVTPLHCAVSTGQLEAVRWLLGRGASARTLARSSYRSDRVPPLFLADHPDVVRELLVHGADPLAVPDPGYMNTLTALQLAYLRGNYAVAQELEEWGGDVALTPFHSAAGQNDVTTVRKFLRKKTDVNCLGELGYVGLNRRTPLHWAAVSGALEVVDILLEAGADPNFQDARGRTPLHWAARLNRTNILRSLLKAGADVKIVDVDYMTPLICAASGLDATREVFSILTSAGADINAQLPTSGDTALHIAVREENEQSALAILANGGNLMKMNIEGLRPLDCTTSTRLLFEVKRAAGQRDVMISYTHSHAEFAKKIRKALEEANVTTWLDLMDPSGIGGGSVWREEIARGITNAAVVLCLLTEDYAQSEWCLKELALAKQVGTPILAVSTEGVRITETLQVYLYTRQLIPFEPAILQTKRNSVNARQIEYDYDEIKFQAQFRLLLDGVRDEIEKNRDAIVQKNIASSLRVNRLQQTTTGTILASTGTGFSRLFQPWDPNASGAHQPFVFLSHGDKHSNFVQQLHRELTDAGIACYGDRNVDGQQFEARIHAAQEAILRCTCFLVILSTQTMTNELVRDQLAFAEDKGRPIFPITLNDLDIDLDKRYSLARNELFHFMGDGMSFKPSVDRLIQGLRRYYSPRENTTLDMTRIASVNTSFVSFTFSEPEGKDIDRENVADLIIQEGDVLRDSLDFPRISSDPNTETRNFESISGIEDAHIYLSGTHIRI